MLDNQLPVIHFSAESFRQNQPAELAVVDWKQDETFVNQLCQSWYQQYADYLGKKEADVLLSKLVESGEIMQHDPRLTIVATIKGRHVGIGSLRTFPGFALITMLEVLPEYRSQGIGKQLLEALVATNVSLVAHVSVHRPAVKRFYESLGFVAMSQVQVDHYGHLLWFDVLALRR